METMKRLPYGMTNFEMIRLENYYYVDKTMFIPKMEAANRFFFFIRPRRFGKTLHMAMLRNYYDIATKDKFEALFKGLYIYDHPTPERNSYLILYLNFAEVGGSIEGYVDRMDKYILKQCLLFCDKYALLIPSGTKESILRQQSATGMVNCIFQACSVSGKKVYLFADEYGDVSPMIQDSHANENDTHSWRKITLAMESLFDVIKCGTTTSVSKIYASGTLNLQYRGIATGFNIGSNYTDDYRFNGMIGFSEPEVREMLEYYSTQATFNHTVDELLEIMRPWYDNYCFAPECIGEPTLFNSDMVLYFLDQYVNKRCQIPMNMIDDNIRTDYSKIRMLIRRDKEFAHDASILQKIVEDGGITGTLKRSFPSETVTDPDNFLSLLYYFGMLTLDHPDMDDMHFVIPNQVVREQVYTYILRTYNDVDLTYEAYELSPLIRAFRNGDWRPYFDYIAECLKRYSSHRDKQKGEAYVHGFTLAMVAQNRYFIPISEAETGVSTGYADLYLQPLLGIFPQLQHSYIVELKYAKGSDPESRVQQLRREAIDQANRYASSDLVQSTKGHTTLHKLIAIFHGMDMAVCEEID